MINIGTHMSLVRRPNGKFLLLDSYELDEEDREELLALTDQGALIDAVLNVHPFHTVHCDFVHDMLPDARFIGTRRHHEQAKHLRWDTDLMEHATTQQQFADCLDFSIPAGVHFIPDDESVHVSSVMVHHRESGTIHVDDTLMYIDLPALVEKFGGGPKLRFHPKLADGLERRAGAADEFVEWAQGLARDWQGVTTICTAHKGIMRLNETAFPQAIDAALEHAAETLEHHRKSCG